jgi:hypothetical protein
MKFVNKQQEYSLEEKYNSEKESVIADKSKSECG